MIDWITSLLFPSDELEKRSTVDPDLLAQLREQLKECEAAYRAGAYLCRHTCPERIKGEPERFAERMIDLHRGLLIKIFIEVARCDREWDPEEREVAMEVLHHVWGVDVDEADMAEVLRNVSELDDSLQWETVLGPFVRFPVLAEQQAALQACLTRIANLIVKADGRVLPEEKRGLNSIQAAINKVFDTPHEDAARGATSVSQAGEQVAQLLQAQPSGREGRPTSVKTSEAESEKKSAADCRSPEKVLAEAVAELNGLIGLEALKGDVRRLVDFLTVQEQREKLELLRTQVSLHSVFCGNPGTGKTTVARIVSQILRGLHLLQKGHTVETDRSGLVAEYAGQTGPKVNKRVDEALDGVLFVDEAYSLVAKTGDDPFGSEAVQVLLKRMEDDRQRLVVVLAGYPEPMEQMMGSNPGLASRFQRTFHFPDYTAAELLQIFENQCKKSQYVLSAAAREKLQAVFQAKVDARDEQFGNARLARNLFENTVQRMASRIVGIAPITRELLTKLEPDDISDD